MAVRFLVTQKSLSPPHVVYTVVIDSLTLLATGTSMTKILKVTGDIFVMFSVTLNPCAKHPSIRFL